ncbi:MAG: small nuclear ribonucleoprotein (snRNP)-like protein [Saprospiraceae bacterium]|jgi:small nuclear ribonucleoprotein (snRNP)-like protein
MVLLWCIKGELSANIDYNTNIILEDFIFIDTKNGKNRYLVIDEKKVYILNGEERSDITLCTYLDEN